MDAPTSNGGRSELELGAVPSGARRHQRMVEEGDLTLPPPRGSFVSRHKLALIGCAGCSLIVVGAVYRRDLASPAV